MATARLGVTPNAVQLQSKSQGAQFKAHRPASLAAFSTQAPRLVLPSSRFQR